MPTLMTSTDGVPSSERFDYWRDAMCANFYGMTFDVEPSKRPNFEGHLAAKPLGDAALVELQASSCIIHRLDKEIEAAPGDALFFYRQRTGAAWIEAVDRRERFVVGAGALAIGDSNLPFNTAPLEAHDYDCTILKIPMRRFDEIGERRKQLSARHIDPAEGIGYLISSHFEALCHEVDRLPAPAADVAIQTLTQLVAVATGIADARGETGRGALRTGKRRAVNQFIDKNLHRPDLSPALAAHALGISVRQLHWLYEPTGITFAQRVRIRRIERARSMIIRQPNCPVIDIVYACGFESAATFYRTFKRALGMSPNDLRASTLEDH